MLKKMIMKARSGNGVWVIWATIVAWFAIMLLGEYLSL